ncbi:hypothetical protein D043_4886B, partial [Vibrio parahaemolyticus EKP-021]
FMNICKE